MNSDISDVLAFLGFAFVVSGVGLLSLPFAFIVAGLGLLIIAVLIELRKVKRGPAGRTDQ